MFKKYVMKYVNLLRNEEYTVFPLMFLLIGSIAYIINNSIFSVIGVLFTSLIILMSIIFVECAVTDVMKKDIFKDISKDNYYTQVKKIIEIKFIGFLCAFLLIASGFILSCIIHLTGLFIWNTVGKDILLIIIAILAFILLGMHNVNLVLKKEN